MPKRIIQGKINTPSVYLLPGYKMWIHILDEL